MEKDELIEGLRLLCQVQEFDVECENTQHQIDEIEPRVSRIKNELKTLEEEMKKEKKELENLIVERKEKELELDSNEETLRKRQAQLYSVKTNKEYSSLLHEIEEIKRKNSHLEDNILQLMETIESREDGLLRKRKKLDKEWEEFNKKEQEEREKEKSLKEKLTEKKTEREKLAVKVNKTLLKRYERISSHKGGSAIVPLVDSSCGGCHLQIPPQTVNEIKSASKIIICEGCARIIYWEDNLK